MKGYRKRKRRDCHKEDQNRHEGGIVSRPLILRFYLGIKNKANKYCIFNRRGSFNVRLCHDVVRYLYKTTMDGLERKIRWDTNSRHLHSNGIDAQIKHLPSSVLEIHLRVVQNPSNVLWQERTPANKSIVRGQHRFLSFFLVVLSF